jgi:hypothetical protein
MTDAELTNPTPSSADAPLDNDPFVAEVRETRAAIAREAGYDLHRIVEDLRRIEAEESARGRVIIATGTPVPGAAA